MGSSGHGGVWADLARTVCVVAVFACVIALPTILNTAIAGRRRIPLARIHIQYASPDCAEGNNQTFHLQVRIPGGWHQLGVVHGGDCITLSPAYLTDFRLCCPDNTRCVDYTVPCDPTNPPQCVSEYPL